MEYLIKEIKSEGFTTEIKMTSQTLANQFPTTKRVANTYCLMGVSTGPSQDGSATGVTVVLQVEAGCGFV